MDKFIIDYSDESYRKVIANETIKKDSFIGIWFTEFETDEARHLYQKGMMCKWYETSDLGRYCNHSETPNTIVMETMNSLEIFASKDIKAGEEIFINYKEATKYTGYIPDLDFML